MLGSGWFPGTIGLRNRPSPRSALRWPSTPRAQLEACGAAQPGAAACPGDAPPNIAPPPNSVPSVKRRVNLMGRQRDLELCRQGDLIRVPDPREEFPAGIV